MTEDERVFGKDAWVYCRAHVKPHQTGWCGVGCRDKIGLGVTTAAEAYTKARDWGLPIYSDALDKSPSDPVAAVAALKEILTDPVNQLEMTKAGYYIYRFDLETMHRIADAIGVKRRED